MHYLEGNVYHQDVGYICRVQQHSSRREDICGSLVTLLKHRGHCVAFHFHWISTKHFVSCDCHRNTRRNGVSCPGIWILDVRGKDMLITVESRLGCEFTDHLLTLEALAVHFRSSSRAILREFIRWRCSTPSTALYSSLAR